MPKHKLDAVDALPQVAVVAISCHVPDYRLCWSLNRALGLRLERRAQDITERAKDKELRFTVFDHRDAEGGPQWTLVSNACGKRRLIASQQQADFFLVVGQDAPGLEGDLLARLRAAEFVLMAYPVDIAQLRMSHKLLL
ncbi:MAG: IPExxxVDY family protein [Flavobacteriales bacterium]